MPRLSGFVEVTISIHALREEGDSALHTRLRCAGTISIHALREEGDQPQRTVRDPVLYFYPRPPRGGRRSDRMTSFAWRQFLSTPSARRATYASAPFKFVQGIFLSTPSARRATEMLVRQASWNVISIHALREEGDDLRISTVFSPLNFYPRPPRGGRREHGAARRAGG